MDVRQLIEAFIIERVNQANYTGYYRRPLIGFVNAKAPIFKRLKQIISKDHYLPTEILPQAKTVIVFFIPFSRNVVRENKHSRFIARVWAEAYIFTNKLIEEICRELCRILQGQAVNAAWIRPTYEFDETRLISRWSHKHIAYATGLGLFGRHHMIVTRYGAAERLGSMVIDKEVNINASPPKRLYLYPGCKGCNYCIEVCPVSALKKHRLDKRRCYDFLLKVDNYFSDLELTDVCGKCLTGPCAILD